MSATTLGDLFMAKLLRPYENFQLQRLSQLQELALQILGSHTFWLAITCFLAFFITWLSVLSYEELSFALPLTSITYILNAFLAGPILGEHVSPMRWLGTIIIGIGVVIVSLSEGREKAPLPAPQSEIPAIQ